MKKIISLVLALVMLFSFTACSPKTPLVQPPEPEFSLGTIVDNTYENPFIGLGIALGDDWRFHTEDEIKELNNLATDLIGDEYEETVKNAELIYDMFAQNTNDFSSINVIMEKKGKGNYDEDALVAMLRLALPELEDVLVSAGFDKAKESGVVITKIGNERFPSTLIHSTLGENDFYQKQLCKNVGEYLIYITISTTSEATLTDIIEQFYIIG